MSKKFIRVTGKGVVTVKPDVMCISVTINDIVKDYQKCLDLSVERTNDVKALFKGFGFTSEDIKTISFGVKEEYQQVRDENGNYKREFRGYVFRHTMMVQFDFDNKRLGEILKSLASESRLKAEFGISYTVKDKEAVKNEVIVKAVKDAKAKAELIREAADIRVSHIQKIDYSWQEVIVERRNTFGGGFTAKESSAIANAYEMDIQPDDITVEDTVTLEYALL